MSVYADWPEPAEYVGWRECCELAKTADAKAGEQVDEIGIDLTERLQPTDRERRTERRRPRRFDHDRVLTSNGQASSDARGEATIGHPHSDRCHHITSACVVEPECVGDDVMQMLGQRSVAPEITRRPASRHAQPARFDEIDPRGDVGNGSHDRFELASITGWIVIEEHDVRTPLLRLPTALADHDAFSRSRSRARHNTMCPHHRGRDIVTTSRSDDRPVGTPDGDHPHRITGSIDIIEQRPEVAGFGSCGHRSASETVIAVAVRFGHVEVVGHLCEQLGLRITFIRRVGSQVDHQVGGGRKRSE